MSTINSLSIHNISQFNKEGAIEIRCGISYTQALCTPPPLLLDVEPAGLRLYTQHDDTLVTATLQNYRYCLGIHDTFGKVTQMSLELRRRLLAKTIFAHFIHHAIPYKIKQSKNKSHFVTVNEFTGTEVGWFARVGSEYKRGVIGLNLPNDASLSLKLVVFASMLLVGC